MDAAPGTESEQQARAARQFSLNVQFPSGFNSNTNPSQFAQQNPSQFAQQSQSQFGQQAPFQNFPSFAPPPTQPTLQQSVQRTRCEIMYPPTLCVWVAVQDRYITRIPIGNLYSVLCGSSARHLQMFCKCFFKISQCFLNVSLKNLNVQASSSSTCLRLTSHCESKPTSTKC